MITKIHALFASEGSLARRAISAGLWRLGGHGVGLVVRLGGNLVMTRILAPEAFGLMAIVIAVQIGLIMFSDFGIKTSVVRSKNGDDPSFLRTAWTLQVFQFTTLAVLFAAIGAGLSVLQGSLDFGETVYGDDRLPAMMALAAVAVFAQGLVSTNMALADRRLLQARVILIETTGQFVTVGAMVTFALFYPTVWALVFGMICGGVFNAVSSHLFMPGPRMALTLNRGHVLEIWNFGKWLVGASMMGFFANQGDRLVLSLMMAKDDFGLYAIAMIWVNAVQVGLRQAMSPTLAALSEVWRERKADLTRAMRKVRIVQDGLCLAAGLPLILFSQDIIDLLYSDEYARSGLYLSLLGFILIFARYQPFAALLLTAGDSKRIALTTLTVSMSMMIVTPVVFLLYGPYWAALAIGVNQVWSLPTLLKASSRHMPLSGMREAIVAILILAVAAIWASVISPIGPSAP